MKLIAKIKDGKKFMPLDMPPVEQITAKHFKPYIGKPVAVEFQDVHRNYYAYGDDGIKDMLQQPGRVVMDMESFVLFWQYRILDFGLDTFAKVENYAERYAVMTAEGASDEEVDSYTATRPDLYSAEELELPDDF